jgi:hypothetical protein
MAMLQKARIVEMERLAGKAAAVLDIGLDSA